MASWTLEISQSLLSQKSYAECMFNDHELSFLVLKLEQDHYATVNSFRQILLIKNTVPEKEIQNKI